MRLLLPSLVAMLLSAPALAADAPASAAPAVGAGSLAQVLLWLLVVLGLLAGTAWLMKRMGVAGAGAGNVARVVGGVSVGNREKVLVVEVADQWIVVGVAPGRVSALSTMPRQEIAVQPSPATVQQPNFAAWLKQTMDKRNGR
ncbi:MAG TPA: flagellar biosynthetic protein FliO [Noviherbaspirillum sp.]|jgi:flagellar protein FliO/FliZ|uniref:flagellar biosynthetic protein FliO n=1 Tax=Noviherbaspirillum sp. TaxID=1926288 RepID=UPI002F94B0FD